MTLVSTLVKFQAMNCYISILDMSDHLLHFVKLTKNHVMYNYGLKAAQTQRSSKWNFNLQAGPAGPLTAFYFADIGITTDTTSDISSTCVVLALVAGRKDCQPRPNSQ